jgi:hypothetical protein
MADELPSIEPEVLSGVPFCSEQCPQHDGKRCRLLGARPGTICEPGVDRIIADRNRLQNHVPGLTAMLDELSCELASERRAHEETRRELAYVLALHETTGRSLAEILERAASSSPKSPEDP